jgi:phage tail-like protein
MATGKREDPLTGYHFYVEIKNSGVLGSFRECSGLSTESQVVELKQADEKGRTVIFKVPGTTKVSDITLKRGMTSDLKIWDWRKKVEDGQVDKARVDGSVVLFDQKNGEVARWNFKNAWPTKVSGPSLNATSNDIAVEELVIAHEELLRVK